MLLSLLHFALRRLMRLLTVGTDRDGARGVQEPGGLIEYH
jgi:hypothetical protein